MPSEEHQGTPGYRAVAKPGPSARRGTASAGETDRGLPIRLGTPRGRSTVADIAAGGGPPVLRTRYLPGPGGGPTRRRRRA